MRPVASTETTLVSDALQPKVMPGITLPERSRATAVLTTVSPVAMVSGAVTRTLRTSVCTAIGAVPTTDEVTLALGPAAVALIEVDPLTVPFTQPVDDTFAMAGSALLQVKVTAGMAVPDALRASATSWIESPGSTIVFAATRNDDRGHDGRRRGAAPTPPIRHRT